MTPVANVTTEHYEAGQSPANPPKHLFSDAYIHQREYLPSDSFQVLLKSPQGVLDYLAEFYRVGESGPPASDADGRTPSRKMIAAALGESWNFADKVVPHVWIEQTTCRLQGG
ncbi:MAG: hypothetical protein ACREVV_05695, partial [Steroidobacteraceae bacterium]